MRNRKIIPVLIVMLICGVSVAAAAAQSPDAVLRAVLDNGLRVVIVHDSLAPVVTTEINYLVGSNEAPKGFPGMAHAQEHMMFRGSPGLSADQLAAIAAALGGEFDADTQQTVTQYFFTVPAENLETVLRIEALRMRDVLDDDSLWNRERGAIEQEVARDFSNPMYVFYSRLLKTMFPDTVYEHDALGTRESFDKTTGAMLKDFYRKWYAPNNAILVIVGNVDPGSALALVKRYFEKIPARPIPARPKVVLPPPRPATIQLNTDFPYALTILAYRLPGYRDRDYAAARVLADVLNSQRGALKALQMEGRALFTGFDTQTFPETGLGFVNAAIGRQADAQAMIKQLKQIIAACVNQGFSRELVTAAKRRELTDAELEKNSVSGLASAWSQALAVEGRRSPDQITAMIGKVTADDVNRVARKYLVNDQAVVGILTPHPAAKPVTVKGAFGGKETFLHANTKPVRLPPWARKIVDRLPSPVSSVEPVSMRLTNGIRLIVQPETVSHSVSVFGRVKNNPDLETPPGQEGVDEVLAELFSYGTKRRDRLQFEKAVDDIGAELSVGTDFSLQTLTESFDRGTALLAENLLSPALPQAAFKLVQQKTAAEVAGRLQSPGFHSQMALLAALHPRNDPSLRHPTPASVRHLTLENVKAYYRKVFRPDLTTMVVIGDITPQQAREVIQKYFGAWKATGPPPPTDLPPVPPNRASTSVIPDPSRVQDQVTLAETVGINRFHTDYYPLQLGMHVLSGGFYSTRLYRDLREIHGLVYNVDAYLTADRTRSHLFVVYGCDPVNVGKARSLVIRDLDAMRSTAVSHDELTRAKILLIRQVPLGEASVDSIAARLLHLSVDGLPLNEALRAARRYSTISAKEVQQAFSRWIRIRDLVQVTQGPNPR